MSLAPRIAGGSEAVWNHDETVRNNVFVFSRDAQVWGWFDVPDERHRPKSMQTAPPTGLSLEDLKLPFANNLYSPSAGQELFNWGVTWKKHKRYVSLDDVRKDLSLDQGSTVAEFHVEDYSALDLRVPADNPPVGTGCYPHGRIPGVQLGTLPRGAN